MTSERQPNKMITLKFPNKRGQLEEREVEISHNYTSEATSRSPYVESWSTVQDVIYVRIGRSGNKLWETSVTVWLYADGKYKAVQNTVNNRNSSRTSIVRWVDADDGIETRGLSQHKGQVAKELRKATAGKIDLSPIQFTLLKTLVENGGTIDTTKVQVDGRAVRGLVGWARIEVDMNTITITERGTKAYESNKDQ